MLKQIVFLLLFFVSVLHAAEVDHLYLAEVAVADQGQQERNRAIAAGFRQMLIKVTGNRNVARHQGLAETFRKASRYVQQYRYRVEAAESGQATERRYLKITFDKQAVDRTLRGNGLPVWGKSRPQLIVWAGFDNGGKRKLLVPEYDQQLITLFNRAADSRGVPLLFPLMDLQDQSAISASDLWGAFEGPVRSASERYQADAILMVRIKSSGGVMRSSWSYIGKNDSRQWEFREQSLDSLANRGMNAVADHLASIYAPVGGGDSQMINMQVSGLNTFADLLKVESFLKNQETVQSYQLRQTQADKVILALSLRSGLQSFMQVVQLSGLFDQEQVEFPVSLPEPVTESAQASDFSTSEQAVSANQQPNDVDVPEGGSVPLDEVNIPEFARDALTDIHLFYRLR